MSDWMEFARELFTPKQVGEVDHEGHYGKSGMCIVDPAVRSNTG